MNVFWWGEIDDLFGLLPALHYTAPESNTVMIEYGDKRTRLEQLVASGYVEISRRTAHTMGLPV